MVSWLRQPNTDSASIGDSPTREITWLAPGVTGVQQALDDVNFPVAINDAYPDAPGSLYRAQNIRVIAVDSSVASVTASYTIPADGNAHPEPIPDVSLPAIFNWSTVTEQVSIDRDRDGNALHTSSRTAIEGLTQARNYKRLTVTSWETGYSVSTSFAYENRVNDAAFEGANAGEVKCVVIQPNQSFDSSSALIGIDYVFDFKPSAIWGDQPWQTVVEDVGSYGVADGKLRRFVTASGELLSNIQLDGFGRPLDTTVTYFADASDLMPVNNPTWDNRDLPIGSTIYSSGSDFAKLLYMTLQSADFSVFNF